MKMLLIAAVTATMLGAHPARAATHDGFSTTPRVAWADADPADSLYRRARQALNDKDYEEAARLFDRIVSSYPRSEYAPDAFYWKGFALYRNGSLEDAQAALEAQAKRYPNAPTRGDAAALLISVKAQLARRGDAEAKRDVNTAAASSGKSCADMELQSAALDALQQMDSERVLPLLKRVLARRDECSVPLRKNALFILAQKRGPDREKLLLEVAKTDPNSQVRSDAVFHLSQTGSDLTIDALEDLLLHSDEKSVRSNALFALAQQKSDRATQIIRRFAISDDAPSNLRNDAIFHLAQRKGDTDAEWLIAAYGKTNDQETKKNIMFYLAQRAGPESNKWLMSVITDAKEPFERRKDALFHLAQRHAQGGDDDIVNAYDKVPVSLKKEILFYIAQRRDGAALDKLISIAKSDPDPGIRKDALFYVGQSKDPKALKALEDILNP